MNSIAINKYLGFAKKSCSLVYGLDNIKSNRKKLFILICCQTASQNLIKEMNYLSVKFQIPIYHTQDYTIDEVLGTTNCKAIAVANNGLAQQIINILEQEEE